MLFLQKLLKCDYVISVLKVLQQHIWKKHHELVMNWILHWQFLFSNVLVNSILKSCRNSLIVQITYHHISDCFRCWKEKLCCRKFNRDSKATSAVQGSLKNFPIKGWMIRPMHIIWGKVLRKRMIYFLLLIYLRIEWLDQCIPSEGRCLEKEWFIFCC